MLCYRLCSDYIWYFTLYCLTETNKMDWVTKANCNTNIIGKTYEKPMKTLIKNDDTVPANISKHKFYYNWDEFKRYIPYDYPGNVESIEINVRKDKQDESWGNGLFI